MIVGICQDDSSRLSYKIIISNWKIPKRTHVSWIDQQISWTSLNFQPIISIMISVRSYPINIGWTYNPYQPIVSCSSLVNLQSPELPELRLAASGAHLHVQTTVTQQVPTPLEEATATAAEECIDVVSLVSHGPGLLREDGKSSTWLNV